jgi:uncharacterized protein (UPF0212 family)
MSHVWEYGKGRPLIHRALTLLSASDPETPMEELIKLSIGQRDARLLILREWTFGSTLRGIESCPGCGERLELTFTVKDILVDPITEQTELITSHGGYEVRFRLPNSEDLTSIADHKDIIAARQHMLKSCILTVHHNGENISSDKLPANVDEAIINMIAESDPQSDILLALSCPTCGHKWQAMFDIVSFFWIEINAWVYRILQEVHTLALAYGWREDDILAMSPHKRQLYLEMIGG